MDTRPTEKTDVWIRWDWLWSAMFYSAVAISAFIAILERDAGLWLMLGITLLWIVWHALGMRLAYNDAYDWDNQAWMRLIVTLGDIVFWFILVNMSPDYYLALFGMFSQFYRHLPLRFAVPVTVIQVSALAYLQVRDEGRALSLADPILRAYLFLVVAGILLGIWISAIIEQSSKRRELIEQLEATQAQLAEAKHNEGKLEERQRLAREIHDTLAQGFTSVVMHLEAAEQALPDNLDVLQKHLDQARAVSRTSLEQARRVVQDLRPELLERQALPEAIGRAAERWFRDSDIPVDVNITGERYALHPEAEVTLLRATQEALNNVRKHAGAKEVCLTLSYMEDVVILDVHDDGQGVQDNARTKGSGGFGLLGMQERVEELGGQIILESEPDEGTTLVVSIPVSSVGGVAE